MKHELTFTTLGALLLASVGSAQAEPADGLRQARPANTDPAIELRGDAVPERGIIHSQHSTAPKPARPAGEEALAGARSRAVGLTRVDGELLGAGPDYRAHFTRGSLSFVPALGRGVERIYPVSFSLDSVSRGAQELYRAPATGVSPEQGDLTVDYRHPGFLESYAIRPEGVELFLTFDQKPAGSGDLVVKGNLSTDLETAFRGETPGPLTLAVAAGSGERGGVTVGAVTGIGADGASVAGSLRFDGSSLELVLPAEFVETAAYPMVLDPLFGVEIPAPDTIIWNDSNADVAYNATEDRYLVVWERAFALNDVAIRGVRISGSGASIGGLIPIESSAATHGKPAVGNFDIPDRFLVAYQGGSSPFGPFDIYARAVDADDGLVSGRLTVASELANEITPDVGSEQGVADDEAIVVWELVGSGTRAALVTVPSAGTPTLAAGGIVVSTSSGDHKPAITNHGSGPGNWLVVWQRFYTTPAPGDHDILGRIIDYNGTLLTPETFLAGGVSDEEDPAAATPDGTNFAVVFEREDVAGDGDNDIYCLPVTFTGTSLTAGPDEILVRGQSNLNEVDPAIDFAEIKYVVAWAENGPFDVFDYDVVGVSLAQGSCKVCESMYFLDSSTVRTESRPELFARYSANLTAGDQALVAWQSSGQLPPFSSDVNARRVEAIGTGGPVANLGGGCGLGGNIGTTGAVALGNPNFSFTLSGANPSASFAALAVSRFGTIVPCGGCNWLVFDSNPGLIFFAIPSGGIASISATIPCAPSAVGMPLYAQWLVDTPGLSPCFFSNISLSDIVRFTLGN